MQKLIQKLKLKSNALLSTCNLIPFNLFRLKRNRGFTIIELMVSTSIFVIITSIVLVNQSTFGEQTLARTLAYNIGLSVRQAQVFGLSVREFGIGTGSFDIGYGVHFETSSPTSYRIFADINRNLISDGGDGTEEVFSIGRGFTIARICVTAPSSNETCAISTLDITFLRPDPDAFIRVNGNAAVAYQSARIVVQSPRGKESEVTVLSTGQISISQTTQ